MEELEFLVGSDENIQEAEIVYCSTGDSGKETIGLSLVVGMSEKQIDDLCNLVDPEKIHQIPTGFEIILTKKDLKKILKIMDSY